MAGEVRTRGLGRNRCPRCDICGHVIRTRGIEGEGPLCTMCLSQALPFVNIVGEGDFQGALREYRHGIQSGAANFLGARFDPFGEEERVVLGKVDGALRGCKYVAGNEIAGCLRGVAKDGGCSLRLLFHNIRSARGPGLELFESELRQWGIPWDVIGLAETWLDSETEKLTSVKGFSFISASRKVKTGGGVALLVREGLVYKERPDLNVFQEGVFESMFIEIVRGGGKANEVVGVVYRPPNGEIATFTTVLSDILGKLRSTEGYLMGDYNIDLLKAQTYQPISNCIDSFFSHGFFPLISGPTRITDSTATLIDNIWTNNIENQHSSGLVTVRISDHLPIFAFVGGHGQSKQEQGEDQWRRQVNEGRIARFAVELSCWTYDEIRSQGIETNVARFRNEFRDMYDRAFPWVKKKRNKKDEQKPWLDEPEFKGLVQEKGKLFSKKLKGQMTNEESERLIQVTKEVNGMRRRLKRSYFETRLTETKGEIKAVWEVLGEVLKGRRKGRGGANCGYFEEEGTAVTDGKQIANGFCKFYCKVGPELAARVRPVHGKTFRDYLGERIDESLILRPTTPSEVEGFCKELVAGKGAGWDGVSPSVIKEVAGEIAEPLSRLYNSCMRDGHYPTFFKTARVVPVFKAEDPTLYSNYRPVSVLPVLSQIFERILKTRLENFFIEKDIIIPGQYGFRAGHSTDLAITDMVEKIRRAWRDGDVSLGVFLDLKKAFDTVDHQILLSKMEHLGVRGKALELLRSYLGGRTQYVCYGGLESDRGDVLCWVSQGSVLGPLFFLIYVNDMIRASKELDFILFADDTNLFARGRNPADLFAKVNQELEELGCWFRCNKLTLNLKKTEYVYFKGPGRQESPENHIELGGEMIQRAAGAKFLGVWIDENLKWTGHTEKVRGKVSRLVGVLGKASSVLGGKQLHMLYNALVLPHLQYCLMVWGDFQENGNKGLGDAILSCQKKLAGFIAGKREKHHSDPVFAQFSIIKVSDLYKQQIRTYAWRFKTGTLPPNHMGLLERVDDKHSHNTRSARAGIFLSTRDHKSVGYRVPKEWDTLSEEMREVRTLKGFKNRSKDSFLSAYRSFSCSQRGCFVCGDGRSRNGEQ